MMQIEVSFPQLMAMRRAKNVELHANDQDGGNVKDLYVQVSEVVLYHTAVLSSSAEWAAVSAFVNKPIIMYDRRICTHNFANSSTWGVAMPWGGGETGTSKYTVKPETGWKYFLTHNIIRFPKTLGIVQENKLHYRLFLSADGVTPVANDAAPTIDFVYGTVYDLLQKANTYIGITSELLDQSMNVKLTELLFQYGDQHTLKGTPIALRSSLNERVDAYVSSDIPMVDKDGNPYTLASCEVLMNFRRTPEF